MGKFNISYELKNAKAFEDLVIAMAKGRGDLMVYRSFAKIAAEDTGNDTLLKASRVTNWRELRDLTNPGRVEELKSAIAAGTTADSTWALPLVALQTLQDAWFASLRNQSMLDALVAGGMFPAVPGIKLPIAGAIGSASAVSEVGWKLLTKFSFTGATTSHQKAAALIVITDELFRFGGVLAENALRTQLRNLVSTAADVSVAGVLASGLTPIASTGSPRQDLRLALAALNLSESSKPMVFGSPAAIKEMAMEGDAYGPPAFPDLVVPTGGSISGMPVLAVDALTQYASHGDCLLVVDAAQLAGGAGGIDVRVSKAADIEMTDNASGGSVDMVSMFQTNSLAIIAERWFNVERIRDASAALVSNVHYTSGSSP